MFQKFLIQMRQYKALEQQTRKDQSANVRAIAWNWIMSDSPDEATRAARVTEFGAAIRREYDASFELGEPPQTTQ